MENDGMDNLFDTHLKITVSGKVASGKTTLLSIIKDCLERDFVFRTKFAGCKIELEEKVEDLEDEV